MAGMFEEQERTEAATPKKRDEARRKGNIASSQEATTAVLLVTATVLLLVQGGDVVEQIQALIDHTMRTLHIAAHRDPSALFKDSLLTAMRMTVPLLGVLVLASVGVAVAQVGRFTLFLERVMPSAARLDPLSGFSRLLSLRSGVKLCTSFLKVLALCLMAWFTVRGELSHILQFGDHAPVAALTDFTRLALKLAMRVGMVMVVIGAADYAYQLWQHEKDLRMTKMEVQEEAKSSEGDPHIRGRQRSAARKMAKQRMVDAVKGAAVVITNPTHFAVALQYEPATTPAPRVLAKGRDYLAQRIMEEARRHGVPIHRDQPLARSLYKDVEVGVAIPPKFYKAVAAILAHVLRQKSRSLGARS